MANEKQKNSTYKESDWEKWGETMSALNRLEGAQRKGKKIPNGKPLIIG